MFPFSHITNFDALRAILQSQSFRYSYSREIVNSNNLNLHFVTHVPMVCFCVMSIPELISFRQSYGECAIILKSDFYKGKSGFSPVLYVSEESELLNTYFRFGQVLHNMPNFEAYLGNITDQLQPLAVNTGVQILTTIKSFYGKLIRKRQNLSEAQINNPDIKLCYYESHEEYCFGQEREWRALPDNYLNYIVPEPSEKSYNEMQAIIQEKRNVLIANPLKFEPNNIEKIIVQSQQQVVELRNLIDWIQILDDNASIFEVVPNFMAENPQH